MMSRRKQHRSGGVIIKHLRSIKKNVYCIAHSHRQQSFILFFLILFIKIEEIHSSTTIVTSVSSNSASTLQNYSSEIESTVANNMNRQDDNNLFESFESIAIVFSDLDGTLIHYPKNLNEFLLMNKERSIISLPPSKTGMVGCISTRTIDLCNEIRKQTTKRNNNDDNKREPVRLVFVSGMRSSTLLSRIPYLPKADVYCCDSGGRIFFRRSIINDQRTSSSTEGNYDYVIQEAGSNKDASMKFYRRKILNLAVQTTSDKNDNDDDNNMSSFVLEEDIEWRNHMEMVTAAGPDGFVGNEAIGMPIVPSGNAESIADNASITIPVSERRGTLWEYANSLLQIGIVLDLDGYSSCFRINRKHQPGEEGVELFDHLLQSLTSTSSNNLLPKFPFDFLASSTNLGCIDIYPKGSGKKNCCEYLARKFLSSDENIVQSKHSVIEEENTGTCFNVGSALLSNNCVCLCDDDNDIEMALGCSHAFLPCISSMRMKGIIRQYPNQFTVTFDNSNNNQQHDSYHADDDTTDYTIATEKALSLVLQRIQSHNL